MPRTSRNDMELLDLTHRCPVCGLPGFPSDFGWKDGKRHRVCLECRRYMRGSDGCVRYERGRKARRDDKRNMKEQELCWRHMDSSMTEEEWDALCDREAGYIAPWAQRPGPGVGSGGETI